MFGLFAADLTERTLRIIYDFHKESIMLFLLNLNRLALESRDLASVAFLIPSPATLLSLHFFSNLTDLLAFLGRKARYSVFRAFVLVSPVSGVFSPQLSECLVPPLLHFLTQV